VDHDEQYRTGVHEWHSFGLLLRQYRTDIGLTQEELAERAGLSARAISALERGARHAPYRNTVQRLVQALHLAEDDRAALEAAARPLRRQQLTSSDQVCPSHRTAIYSAEKEPSPDIEERHNLPAELTSFLGRQDQIAKLAELLATTRLLSLVGPGGVGKTRLALRLARGVLEQYPDGVWLVELAPVADPSLVPQVVASLVGAPAQPDCTALESLQIFVRNRSLLLVLDNCEHLIDSCAELVQTMLRTCPRLRVLVTSREPLNVDGETLWRVAPLGLAALSADTTEQVRSSDAVQLFVARGRALAPGFDLTDENAATIARICRRLDGVPLALELAVGRLAVLSPQQIEARLDDRFRLLAGGHRFGAARHRTLRAALDWSYGLLSAPQQQVLARLSVFAGGCAMEAAEVVCGGDGIQLDNVFDLMADLVNKSFVGAEPDFRGAVRYRLHESVRQYGSERLVEYGQLEGVRKRHAQYYAQLVVPARLGLTHTEQRSWLGLLRAEHDNIRVAVRWAIEHKDSHTGSKLGAGMFRFWVICGYLEEAEHWLGQLLSLARGQSSDELFVVFGAGVIARERGAIAAAEEYFAECQTRAAATGDLNLLSAALTQLGILARYRGNIAEARALHERALAMRQELGSSRLMSISLVSLADLECGGVAARDMAERAIALARQSGDASSIAAADRTLAREHVATGHLRAARDLLLEALGIYARLENPSGLIRTLEELARLAMAANQPEHALRFFSGADAHRRRVGYGFGRNGPGGVAESVAAARACTDEAAADAAWEEGQTLAIGQLVEAIPGLLEAPHDPYQPA
jgi:predicted ATPase/DNA-binding XRE family transcriptional regulator